jgi:hypothetical protein
MWPFTPTATCTPGIRLASSSHTIARARITIGAYAGGTAAAARETHAGPPSAAALRPHRNATTEAGSRTLRTTAMRRGGLSVWFMDGDKFSDARRRRNMAPTDAEAAGT